MDILIAEDDQQIARSLKKNLTGEGHTVSIASDGEAALEMLNKKSFDALLLDWRMPKLSGIQVCRRLREEGNSIPIILLTALTDISKKVEALDVGADDYITKPFSFEEVCARLKAVFRRSGAESKVLAFGETYLDFISHTLKHNDESIKLSEMEFKLLHYLLEHPQLIVSKEQLSEKVWKLPFLPETNFIEVTVKNLRKKLDTIGSVNYIRTIYGEGYSFIEDEE